MTIITTMTAAAATPAAICPPRPRGALTTRAPNARATATVASVLAPSTTTTSAGAAPSAASVAGSRAAAFSAGMTTESARACSYFVLDGPGGFPQGRP